MNDRRTELAERLAQVQDRIATACADAGRAASDVRLVVVTKFFPASDVEHLAGLGVRDIGESRHQEAHAKLDELAPDVRQQLCVHFIGQLQSNKAAAAARYADVVQSVDRAKVARALGRGADHAGRRLDVTVQVDLAGDDGARGGVRPDGLMDLAAVVATESALRLRGVMAVAPLDGDPADAFARLRQLSAQVRAAHPEADWISAGMSGDLEQAVAAGATHLRVGSAILGSRPVQR